MDVKVREPLVLGHEVAGEVRSSIEYFPADGASSGLAKVKPAGSRLTRREVECLVQNLRWRQ